MKSTRLVSDLTPMIDSLLTSRAAYDRVGGKAVEYLNFSRNELFDFCEPLREVFQRKFSGSSPQLSVVMRAFNEEREILATLLSYGLSDVDSNQVEIIVVNNNSSDRTNEIIEAVGVRSVDCTQRGIGHTTKCGYEARSTSSQFILITDADTRVVPPLRSDQKMTSSKFLSSVLGYFHEYPKCAAVSTGIREETPHWLRSVKGFFGSDIKKASYWAGANQAIRTSILDAIGGINPNIEYGSGEDFYRLWKLWHYCRENNLLIATGQTEEKLDFPVFSSSRRTSTIWKILKNRIYLAKRGRRVVAVDGMPAFAEGKPAVLKEEIR